MRARCRARPRLAHGARSIGTKPRARSTRRASAATSIRSARLAAALRARRRDRRRARCCDCRTSSPLRRTRRAGNADELVKIVDRAMQALDAMRSVEGARLAAYLGAAPRGDRAGGRAHRRACAAAARRAARSAASGGAGARGRASRSTSSDSRRRSPILADRLDVSRGDQPLPHARGGVSRRRSPRRRPTASGKRLGFLLQELLREANTTGSKANDAAIVQDVVLIKEELEKIREQVENLE